MASNAKTVVPFNRDAGPLAKLREPFPDNQISKLPKETRAQIDARKADKNLMVWKCPECGNAHHKNAVHLDYVGHAAATDRLLDTDPEWTWEPLAVTDKGLPAFDENGGLWIRLTVCGVTRLGYGSADGKSGGDAKKEIIGDAIRNAGMRFGMALDLWHKGDLHADDLTADQDDVADVKKPSGAGKLGLITDQQRNELAALGTAKGIDARVICERGGYRAIRDIPADRFEEIKAWVARQKPRAATVESHASDVLEDEIPY